MTTDKNAPRLAVLLTGGLAIWATACYFVHGNAIFAYVGIQALTSGVFAWQMCSIEKSIKQRSAAQRATADERAAA